MGQSLARERERYREHLSLCIPAPNPVPCIFKKSGVQQELGHEDPRTPTLEARRQAEILGRRQASFSGTLPLAELPLSTKHCLKTTVSSSSSSEHTGVLSLHSGPEGHHIELAIMDEAEPGVGHWTKTLLSPRRGGRKPGQSLYTCCQRCLDARQSG